MTILWMGFIVILCWIHLIPNDNNSYRNFSGCSASAFTWVSLNLDGTISHNIRCCREVAMGNGTYQNKNEKSTNASSVSLSLARSLSFSSSTEYPIFGSAFDISGIICCMCTVLLSVLGCSAHHSQFKNRALNWLLRRYSWRKWVGW